MHMGAGSLACVGKARGRVGGAERRGVRGWEQRRRKKKGEGGRKEKEKGKRKRKRGGKKKKREREREREGDHVGADRGDDRDWASTRVGRA